MRLVSFSTYLLLISIPFLSPPALAEDWPQWRGEGGLGVWNETGILESFPSDGLKTVWRADIGSGYSGPVVAEGRIYVLDSQPKPESKTLEVIERLICLEEATGETLWMLEWDTHYRELMGSYATGPRASAAVADGRVYALGSAGNIVCADAGSGELLWAKDSREEFGTTIPIWGTSSSPIVDGDRVIFVTGGTEENQIRAFNRVTGEEIWAALPTNYELGYSTPVIFEAGGARQLIFWDPKALHSLNPETGEVYWSEPMAVGQAMSIATPVRSDDKILVSCFYSGSMLVELDAEQPGATKLWHVKGKGVVPNRTQGLHTVVGTPVIQGDYFYGTDSYGELRCVSLKDSERIWTNGDLTRQGRWGSMFLVRHNDRYFMNNDKGELLIVQFTPEKPIVLGRAPLIEPTTDSGFGAGRMFSDSVNWVHPAYANRHIVTRNDREIIRLSLED